MNVSENNSALTNVNTRKRQVADDRHNSPATISDIQLLLVDLKSAIQCSLKTEFAEFEKAINSRIDERFQELDRDLSLRLSAQVTTEFKSCAESIRSEVNADMAALEQRLVAGTASTVSLSTEFIVKNLPCDSSNDPAVAVADMMAAMKLDHVQTVDSKRFVRRDGNPGLVKVRCRSSSDVDAVLKAKKSLRTVPDYTNVFIEPSKSASERRMEFNFRQLCRSVGDGQLTFRNARIVNRKN